MRENDVAEKIVDCAFEVHSHLGPGLLESVYEAILFQEVSSRGLSVSRQVPIPVSWKGKHFDEGFRADLLVEDCVIVELKAVEKVARVHKRQLLTYLRLSNKRLGLLINFGAPLIKEGISRVVNGLRE